MKPEITLGSVYLGGGRSRFKVWAPLVRRVEVRLLSPRDQTVGLEEREGYHQAVLEGVEPGSLYRYRLDGSKERPDPVSRFQPEGVHGPSQVVNTNFLWQDADWFGLPLRDYVLYELHVGVFTREATFAAVIPHLDDLKELGITAVEIMPVAQFPGARNWGYDGVYPFAVQNSYGGPEGLKRLVNECHKRGLAVVLDVVYNHLGPEGNYLADFGPYFTDRYRTPWGHAVNFDGPENREVRRFFIENALYWISEFHVDALRLDAVHAILDFSARPFLQELAENVHEEAEKLNRRVHLIAESDLNDNRLLRSPDVGGYGLDGQWSDDFHHSLHTLLTGENSGYYLDFGRVKDLKAALARGFVYDGKFSSFRRRPHGNSSRDIPGTRLVICAQNHDQVGNRFLGERLTGLIPFEGLKLAAGVIFLSPYIPLLFMGEEYGEPAPFPYFISHGDPDLVAAVRKGRKEEFAGFHWKGEPPDPQAEATFEKAKLRQGLKREEPHRSLYAFYRHLVNLRKTHPILMRMSKENQELNIWEDRKILIQRRWEGKEELLTVYHFGRTAATVDFPIREGEWIKILDSADEKWKGPGSALPERFLGGTPQSLTLLPLSFFLAMKLSGE